MRRPSESSSSLQTLSLLKLGGLGALGVLAFTALTALAPLSEADLLDPTVAQTIAIGDGGAAWTTTRGGPTRAGVAQMLPLLPMRKSTMLAPAPIVSSFGGPLVTANGGVIVVINKGGSSAGTELYLDELPLEGGKPRAETRIGDTIAASPILLASGVRVVVTQRGHALGIEGSGTVRFDTDLAPTNKSVAKVGLAPLPGGGFSVALTDEIVELDGAGTIVDRVRISLSPTALSVRENGEVLGVTVSGDLYAWRAGRALHLIGTFGEKNAASTGVFTGVAVCPDGPILDGVTNPLPGQRKERAICALQLAQIVEQIDLATGARRALLAKPLLPFHTLPAVGLGGDLAIGSAGATVVGLAITGMDIGPFDVPGSVSALGLFKDAGVITIPTGGNDISPLVDPSGAVLFGGSEGLAIAQPSGSAVTLGRCSGEVVGVASVAPGKVVVACRDGRIDVYVDTVVAPPKPSATPSTPTSTPTSAPTLPITGGDAGP